MIYLHLSLSKTFLLIAASSSLNKAKLDPFFMLCVCSRRSRVILRLNLPKKSTSDDLHYSVSRHAVRFRYLMQLPGCSTSRSNSPSPQSINWHPVMFKFSNGYSDFTISAQSETIELPVRGFRERSSIFSRGMLLIGNCKYSVISASQIEFSAI